MNTISREFVTDAFDASLKLICSRGTRSGTSDKPTREVTSLVLRAENPHQRFLSPLVTDYPTVVMKQLQWLQGIADIETICCYDPSIRTRVEPQTGLYDGAYGPRLKSQMENAYRLLRKTPSSRRAVLAIYTPSDRQAGLDMPSTMYVQFLLRNQKLSAIVNMRSNDFWGGFPTDSHLFGLLQEVMAAWLGVGIGEYTHIAGSAHVYERDLPTIQAYLKSPEAYAALSPPPTFESTEQATGTQVSALLELERSARGEAPHALSGVTPIDDGYLQWCKTVILRQSIEEKNA